MLTRACPACNGSGRLPLTFRGGNDPYARTMPCDECEDGRVPLRCEECQCQAVRRVEDAPLCDQHAREVEAEMLDEDEFREQRLREQTT